jgi:hypothetical protein
MSAYDKQTNENRKRIEAEIRARKLLQLLNAKHNGVDFKPVNNGRLSA